MSRHPTPIECAGVDELISLFDVFLLDQFGVLHNGTQPFRGSIEALQRLQRAGKQCVVISNSGKRAAVNSARLAKLGFAANNYTSVMTSGEVAWMHLRQAFNCGEFASGARCFLLANNGDQSLVNGLDFVCVDSVAEADVVLLAGMGEQARSLDDYLTLFEPVISRGIRCICTNPDKVAISASGKHFSVGRIAEELEQLGASVLWIGKPYAEIYRVILSSLGVKDLSRVACVGDSVEHDVAGGASLGMSTVLVRTGILDELTDSEREAQYTRYQVRPNFIMPAFR